MVNKTPTEAMAKAASTPQYSYINGMTTQEDSHCATETKKESENSTPPTAQTNNVTNISEAKRQPGDWHNGAIPTEYR